MPQFNEWIGLTLFHYQSIIVDSAKNDALSVMALIKRHGIKRASPVVKWLSKFSGFNHFNLVNELSFANFSLSPNIGYYI